MLYNDDEIRQDGIEADKLDDEKIDKAIQGEVEDDEETPTDSSTENKDVKEKDKPSQEGDNTPDEDKLPFHKHPRFKEVIQEKNELKEELEQAKKAIDELKGSIKTEDEPIAGWFKELYGENEEAWKIYNAQSKRDREETKKEVLREIELRSQSAKLEDEKWNRWVDNNINRLQDEGHQFDRNKLLKLMMDYRPTDDSGNLDFDKGIDLYKKMNKVNEGNKDKINLKKKVADATTNDGKSIEDKPSFLSAKQLRHKSFISLAEEGIDN